MNHNHPSEEREMVQGASKNSGWKQAKTQLVLDLHLTGWQDGGSFLDQSQSKVKQTQIQPRATFEIHLKIALIPKVRYSEFLWILLPTPRE